MSSLSPLLPGVKGITATTPALCTPSSNPCQLSSNQENWGKEEEDSTQASGGKIIFLPGAKTLQNQHHSFKTVSGLL